MVPDRYLSDAKLDQFKIYKPKKLRTGKAVEGSESSTGHGHVNKIDVRKTPRANYFGISGTHFLGNLGD